ncbi:MAG: hypothetical protein Q9191_004415 [Dirinaria sp. TL-2023a]
MNNHIYQTIATIDTASDSSDDEYIDSPTFSSGTALPTDTEDGLSSGDEEVMAGASPMDVDHFDEALEDVDQPPTDTENKQESCKDNKHETPSRCEFMKKCNTGSRDYRKVVSHVFGRNKKCTTQLPDECWIVYCRKHYQRTRYRTTKAQTQSYFNVQIDLISRQLTRMEAWGGVLSWCIALRKKEQDEIKQENAQLVQLRASGGLVDDAAVRRIQKCPDRFLLRHVGTNKTLTQVRQCLEAVRQEVERIGGHELPGFELLPNIDPIQYPPAATKRAGDRKRKKQEEDNTEDEGEESDKHRQHRRISHLQEPTRFRTPNSRTLSSSASPLSARHISSPIPKKEGDKRKLHVAQATPRQSPLKTDNEVVEAESSTAASARVYSPQAMMPRKKGIAYRLPASRPTEQSPRRSSGFHPINGTAREVAYRPATPKTPPRDSRSSSETASANLTRNSVARRPAKQVRLDDQMDFDEY